MFLYSRTILSDNLSIASALQLSESDLNSKLCVASGGMQKALSSYLSSFATSYAF